MRAFIAMPFCEHFNAYWEAIQEVCKKFSIETFRVDKNLSYERHIDIAIRKEIDQADFMIAILTGDKIATLSNPNVAFEVGYAQGVNKEVILLAESIDCLSFDFQQQRACLYHEDMSQMKKYLEQEVAMLKTSIEKKTREQFKKFFTEIARCLHIILPPDYRFFHEGIGFQEEHIWYGINLFKEKAFLHYVVFLEDDPNKISIYVWLASKYRNEQKAFAKRYYDDIRKRLGYEIAINFDIRDSSNRLSELKEKNFMSEVMTFEHQTFSTNEALTIALRLRDYVETLQPIFLTFIQEKNVPDML